MSDTQQGPDWWLASDGKWYPPTSSPDWASVASSPAPSPALGLWVQLLLWAVAVFGLLTALGASSARDAASQWVDGQRLAQLREWSDAHEGSTGSMLVLSMAVLAALILTMVWMNTVHKHQARLGPGRRWTSGWTVGAWFIPLGNWLLPKLVLDEIERIAVAPRTDDGRVDPEWRRTRVRPVGWLFWLGWVVGSLAIGTTTVVWDGVLDITEVDLDLDMAAVLDAYTWRVVGGVGMAVAGAFGALHLRRLHRVVLSDD